MLVTRWLLAVAALLGAAWGLAVRHENGKGCFVEIGHWSGHGVPGPSFFRESQWSEVKIGLRFGEKLPLVPVQIR